MANNRNSSTGGGQRNNNTSRRQSSGVPPLNAFDTPPKRRPPNLPGQPGFDPHKGNPGGRTGAPSRQGDGSRGQGNNGSGKANGKNSGKGGGKGNKGGKNGRNNALAKPRKPKKRISPARRRRRRFLTIFFVALALIAAGIWFSLNVLFKIEGYTIDGDTGYTQEELVQAFGFDIGENMFSFNAKNRAETMQQTLPYLESLRIKRKLPGTVVFSVTQAVETFSVEYNGQYAVLSESLKVLRMAETAPEGLIQLYGLSNLSAQPGLPLTLAIAETDDWNPYLELAQPPATAAEEAEEEIPEADGGEGGDTSGENGEGEAGEGEAGEGEQTDGEAAGDIPENGETENAAGEGGDETAGEGETTDLDGEGEGGEGEEGEGDAEEPQPEEPSEPARQELASPYERMEATLELIHLLEDSALDMDDIGWLNVTDTLNLQFRWQGRITVVLGARSNMEEKLACAIVMMTDREQSDIGENERGIVDVSAYITTLMGYFTPE